MTKIRYVGNENAASGRWKSSSRHRVSRRSKKAPRPVLRRRPAKIVLSVLALLALSTAAMMWLVRVESVQVKGATAADLDHLRSIVQPLFGQRIFLLDSSHLRQQLIEDPWIVESSIFPLPTGTLAVRLREANPVFSLEDGGAIRADGRVLPARRGIDVSGLPRLRAPRREGTTELSEVARRLVRELCVALDRTPWTWPSGLSSVEVGNDGNVTLMTGDGVVVVLGSEGWDRRLAIFAKTVPLLRPDCGDRLDYRFQRQVVITSKSGVSTRAGG